MIVKTRYEDLKGTNIKVLSGEKEVTGYLKVVINRDNALEAVKKLVTDSHVVAFQYEGIDFATDMQFLADTFPHSLQHSIIYMIDVSGMDISQITLEYLSEFCNLAPASVRLVFKCPDTFCNMAIVATISKLYPNTRFCGGYLLRAPECNIGCICAADIKGRAFSNINPVVQGCGCVLPNITFEEAEITYVQGTTRSVVASESKKTTPKPKRVTTTLFELGGDSLSAF